MARAEDLRAVRTFLQEERYRIDMQLLDLDRRIMLAEHGAPPPVLNPGRRSCDMKRIPIARADGVMLGVFDSLPRETPVLVGMGEDCGDDWHGAQQ